MSGLQLLPFLSYLRENQHGGRGYRGGGGVRALGLRASVKDKFQI